MLWGDGAVINRSHDQWCCINCWCWTTISSTPLYLQMGWHWYVEYSDELLSHMHLIATGDVDPITLTIVCTPNMLPSRTSAVVTVMYTVSQCHPASHITQHIITLPLSLFCRPVAPAKNAEHKVRSCDANAVSMWCLDYHRYEQSSSEFIYSVSRWVDYLLCE